MARCSFVKADGSQCKLNAGTDSEFCHIHIKLASKKASSSNGWDFSIDEASMAEESQSKSVFDVDALVARIQQLELENKVLRRKLISNQQSSVETKAKLLFYHDNKKRTDIVEVVEERLKKADVIMLKKDGKMYVPWRFVKACTDHVWSELDTSAKEEYMQKAVTNMATK